MKLYKLKQLANDVDYERAKDILETGKIYCAHFATLNDPMEGVFSVLVTEQTRRIIDNIYSIKSQYKICSLTRKIAFRNPAMWGYYANGFKGMAIEIEVNESSVKKIEYVREVRTVVGNDINVEKILTTKLCRWKHEAEYRFLVKSDEYFHAIGRITSIYLGDPYGNVDNMDKIHAGNDKLREYINMRSKLIEIAQAKRIRHSLVRIKDNKVKEM